MHFGKITFDVDERGEVGLLTRNIKIQASADAEQSSFGGHIMAMPSSKMYVSGVELNRMGQHLTKARYPIHWHLVGDAQGPVHQERGDPRHLQPLRDRARHEFPAHRKQRDLQHRRSLLLPRRRHRARQRVRPQPGDPDQVPYDQALRPDQPRRVRRDRERERRTEMARRPRMSCCPRTTRCRVSGSPTRTTSIATTWPRVPTRTASGCHCRSTRTVSSRARRSARPSGRVERHSASSRATSPTPTTTAFMFDRNIARQ